ncbi:BamA/TamA family outer membrane protein [Roseospira visakhapatnamensis]|uniref:Translocation and assembly module TamA n=1 Tax=Roseospira visakhapatnamensis TaxID=390880 RepID=A0A7W6RBX4_9PROT|nr:translocation and assembly module TamA [Roseospira visakhapatnamensis]
MPRPVRARSTLVTVGVVLAVAATLPPTPAHGQEPTPAINDNTSHADTTAAAPPADDPASDAPPPDAGPSVAYSVDLRLTDTADVPGDLATRLEAASSLKALAGDPPATRLGLRRRLEADQAALTHLLRQEGYFDARVDGTIDDAPKAQVTVTVSPGARYRVTGTRVVYTVTGTGDRTLPGTLDPVGLTVGDPARAEAVLSAEARLVADLRTAGRPFAEVRDRRVAVNHARRAMGVRLLVDAGPPAVFGATRFVGLDRMKQDALADRIPWTEGDTFDRALLDRYRTTLLSTRLFRSVTVKPGEAPDDAGRLAVIVTVTEAPPRSIGAGLRYSTEDGPGARFSWEHRTLFGRAESLRVNLDVALYEQSAEVLFEKPRFLHPDQSLRLSSAVTRADQAAYQGLSLETTAALDRRLNDRWRVSAGTTVELANLDDQGESRQSVLVGLPLGATRDTTDDPLDPTQGTRLGLTLTPYTGQVEDQTVTFGVADVVASAYWAPLDGDRLVLAARTRLASLFGADAGDVPATRRLYSGGGGSVRGYGHQRIGPLDDDDDPTGGRSALEVGLEARIKVTETIGLVPFVEAGAVSEATWPDFAEPIQYAAGLGGRYYTDFGPLRVDIGVPLNRRASDDLVQVYISLGQAF